MHVCTSSYACMYPCIHARMYASMCVSMHACMHVFMYVCMYVCMYRWHIRTCFSALTSSRQLREKNLGGQGASGHRAERMRRHGQGISLCWSVTLLLCLWHVFRGFCVLTCLQVWLCVCIVCAWVGGCIYACAGEEVLVAGQCCWHSCGQ